MFQVREKFKLSEKFLDEFKDRQPKWGPLGYATFKRTYARVLDVDTNGGDRCRGSDNYERELPRSWLS